MPVPHFGRCLALPDTLAGRAIALRGEKEAEEPFLERLYNTVRWDELAAVPWPDDVKQDFLKDQFRLQTHHYRTHYANSDFGIVTRNGDPIGRLYLFRGDRDYRIVDISLLPEARGQGIGTALLKAVQAEAGAEGRTVSIHVEQFNPAQTLYRRLEFREVSTNGPYWLMEWRNEAKLLEGVA